MKKPIIDASSAILLYKCGLFPLVAETFSIQLAQAVIEEITRTSYPGAIEFKEYRNQNKINIIEFMLPFDYPADLSAMGSGERDTIGCYLQNKGDFIITDDGKAAKYCSKENIPFINAILVPKTLYFAGHVSETAANAGMDCLIQTGRYSDFVLEFSRNCSCGDLHRFFPK